MGYATITGGGTAGLYDVELNYGTEFRDQRIATLQMLEYNILEQISNVEADVETWELQLGYAHLNQNAAIDLYNASEKTKEDQDKLNLATEEVLATIEALANFKNKLGKLNLFLANIEAELAQLNALELTETTQIWCADYTETGNASYGDTATIEIDGEQGAPPILVPGCKVWSSASGVMIARGAQGAGQVFYNAAILPGWQKWRPTYRVGEITAINYGADTCSVNLDSASSSAQSLNINQSSNLTSVKIEYMSCNSQAFTTGDRVVVQFVGNDWDSPKVIGFESNPKPCAAPRICVYIEDWDVNAESESLLEGRPNPNDPETFHFNVITESYDDSIYRYAKTEATHALPTCVYCQDPAGDHSNPSNHILIMPRARIRNKISVRFDIAWYCTAGSEEFWLNPAKDVPGFTTLEYGDHMTLDWIDTTSDQVSYFADHEIRIQKSDLTIGPDLTEYVSFYGGAPQEVTSHTVSGTTSFERLFGTSPNYKGPNLHNRQWVTDFIETYWEQAPRTLHFDVGAPGEPDFQEYEFVSIGTRPDDFLDWDTYIEIPSRPEEDYQTVGHKLPQWTVGIIYRKKID